MTANRETVGRGSSAKRWRWLLAAAIPVLVAGVMWSSRRSTTARVAVDAPIVIAINPFRAADNQMEPWSGLGLAQELQAALDTVSGWSARVSESEKPPGAHYLLGGSVARKDSRREIGVQLLRLSDRTVLWTGTLWRTEADLASLTGELAEAVVLAIRLDSTKAALNR
jgi:TolB-like protein